MVWPTKPGQTGRPGPKRGPPPGHRPPSAYPKREAAYLIRDTPVDGDRWHAWRRRNAVIWDYLMGLPVAAAAIAAVAVPLNARRIGAAVRDAANRHSDREGAR